MNTRTRTALSAAALLALAGPALAEFDEGDYELRLSGFAQSDVELDGTDLNVVGSIGYFFSDQLEAGARQSFSYTDINASASNGGTAAFVNYHFGEDGGRFQPFIGASLGYNYGDSIEETFFAGPEIGIKYFLENSWFIFGSAEYQFFFEDSDGADESIDDGTFLFRVGLGVVLDG